MTFNEQEARVKKFYEEYGLGRDFEISDMELFSLSLSDLSLLISLLVENKQAKISEENNKYFKCFSRYNDRVVDLVHGEKKLYCVYSKFTNEPYLISAFSLENGRYRCAPPKIMLVTEDMLEISKQGIDESITEINMIEGGISDFLSHACFENGAMGVMVNYNNFYVPDIFISQAPAYREGIEAVRNHEFVRWLLLILQTISLENPDPNQLDLYFSQFSKEIKNVNFLIPYRQRDEKKYLDIFDGEKTGTYLYTGYKKFCEFYSGDEWQADICGFDDLMSLLEDFDFRIDSVGKGKSGMGKSFMITQQFMRDLLSRF